MPKQIRIAGAGLTGLIAAHAFRGAEVFEASSLEDVSRNEHTALLRFRSDAVARITGIPFREVTVQKSVWDGQRHAPLDLALANAYARKVLAATGGKISGRSIWNMAPVQRFIAPPDFVARMRAQVEDRIRYSEPINAWGNFYRAHSEGPIVSTIPLPSMLSIAREWDSTEDFKAEASEFAFAPIQVSRFKLEGVDLHQTVYVPGELTGTYRISITGDVLIIESVMNALDDMSVEEVLFVFGLTGVQCTFLDSKVQTHGKIVEVPAVRRRQLLRKLTERADIYCLGRFATWRNVLLDDVAKDIEVIRRMMSSDAYGRELQAPATSDGFPF